MSPIRALKASFRLSIIGYYLTRLKLNIYSKEKETLPTFIDIKRF